MHINKTLEPFFKKLRDCPELNVQQLLHLMINTTEVIEDEDSDLDNSGYDDSIVYYFLDNMGNTLLTVGITSMSDVITSIELSEVLEEIEDEDD